MGNILKGADTRERILDSADRLLAHYGYAKMTVDDLAEEAGIGKGTVYLYFASKEAVALAHVDRIVERTLAEMYCIAASKKPALLRVRKMLFARVLVRFSAVRNYSKSLDELLAGIRGKLLERRVRHFQMEARLFAEVLREGSKRKEFRAINVQKTADAILWATNSLLPYSLTRAEFRNRARVEARLGQVVRLVTQGLEA
jgi:AcrR family transcriptional regulator